MTIRKRKRLFNAKNISGFTDGQASDFSSLSADTAFITTLNTTTGNITTLNTTTGNITTVNSTQLNTNELMASSLDTNSQNTGVITNFLQMTAGADVSKFIRFRSGSSPLGRSGVIFSSFDVAQFMVIAQTGFGEPAQLQIRFSNVNPITTPTTDLNDYVRCFSFLETCRYRLEPTTVDPAVTAPDANDLYQFTNTLYFGTHSLSKNRLLNTATSTVLTPFSGDIVRVTATGQTITLPTTPSAGVSFIIELTVAGTLTIAAGGSDTIDDAVTTSVNFTTQNEYARFTYNGAGLWYIG